MELSISIGLSGNHMYSTNSVIPSNTALGAPTITGITSGNGQLSVAFTAGTDGGGTISNYQFSTNDGSSWTTRSPSATTSPIVISGLTNGTSYTVRIRAVNEIGSGTQSASSTATPASSSTVSAPTDVYINTFYSMLGTLEWRNLSSMTGVGFDIEIKMSASSTYSRFFTNTLSSAGSTASALGSISVDLYDGPITNPDISSTYDVRIRSTKASGSIVSSWVEILNVVNYEGGG